MVEILWNGHIVFIEIEEKMQFPGGLCGGFETEENFVVEGVIHCNHFY